MDRKFFGDLLVSLYACAAGTAPWKAFLSAIGKGVSASTTVLFSQVACERTSAFLGADGVEPQAIRDYQDYFGARNILLTEGVSLHHPGIVRTSETICSPETLLNSEYYNDFLRPYDIRFSIAVTVVRERDRVVHLSAFRPHGTGPFECNEMTLLSELYPHVRQAIQLSFRLMEQEQRGQALQQVVERTGQGVALLDRSSRVVYINRALEEMIATRDGLVLSRSRLTTSAQEAASALRAAVFDATRGGSGGSVLVSRPSAKPAYSILITPVLTQIPFLGCSQPAASIVVSDPASAARSDVIRLQQAFGLTRAEARVASRLAAGASLRDVSEQLAISIHTARTHVKRILGKTDTSRQSDLIRKILLEMPRF